MHGEDRVNPSAVDIAATQVRNNRSGTQPVTLDVPCGVSDANKCSVDGFEIDRVDGGLRVELGFETVENLVQAADLSTNRVTKCRIGKECPQACLLYTSPSPRDS